MILSKFFLRDFLFCHEDNQLLEYVYDQGAQVPSIQIQ